MERGDIDAVGLDPTRGHEQQGQRPVLVVSATAFNRVTRVPVVVPITSGGAFARTAGFALDRRDPAAQVRRSCRSSVRLMDRRVP